MLTMRAMILDCSGYDAIEACGDVDIDLLGCFLY